MTTRQMTDEEITQHNQYIKYLEKARDICIFQCDIEQLTELISWAYDKLKDKTVWEITED